MPAHTLITSNYRTGRHVHHTGTTWQESDGPRSIYGWWLLVPVKADDDGSLFWAVRGAETREEAESLAVRIHEAESIEVAHEIWTAHVMAEVEASRAEIREFMRKRGEV